MKVRELMGELGKLNSETDIGFALTLPQSEYDLIQLQISWILI